MAMRMDPPEPPSAEAGTTWWTRLAPTVGVDGAVASRHPDGHEEFVHRQLYAKVVVLEAPVRWEQWQDTEYLVLIEFYGDRSVGPGLVQRYSTLAKAEAVLERRGWVRTMAEVR